MAAKLAGVATVIGRCSGAPASQGELQPLGRSPPCQSARSPGRVTIWEPGPQPRVLRGLAIAATSASLSALLFSAITGEQGLAGALPDTTGVTTITAGKPIAVGSGPAAIAITPDGKTAYVVNGTSGTVTPIDTTTNRPGPAITVGREPAAIAITPNGKTAYVVNTTSGTVTPITTATGTAGPPITVGNYTMSIAIAPNGQTAYVGDYGSGTVTVLIYRHGPGHRPSAKWARCPRLSSSRPTAGLPTWPTSAPTA